MTPQPPIAVWIEMVYDGGAGLILTFLLPFVLAFTRLSPIAQGIATGCSGYLCMVVVNVASGTSGTLSLAAFLDPVAIAEGAVCAGFLCVLNTATRDTRKWVQRRRAQL